MHSFSGPGKICGDSRQNRAISYFSVEKGTLEKGGDEKLKADSEMQKKDPKMQKNEEKWTFFGEDQQNENAV